MLFYETFQCDFKSHSNIVGQSVRFNSRAAVIYADMPPSFKFRVCEEIWGQYYSEFPQKPRSVLQLGANNSPPDVVLGRLKPGVRIDQANSEFAADDCRVEQENPKIKKAFVSAIVQTLLGVLTGHQLRQQVWGMLAAVILVFLNACVNVMN